ncbi:MAG: cyclic nucleotide-binding domain-containing protein [Proteobacteria bacterium]|nr:cyclic nucleotide-binding domain-containing protein [Pseudomonadota bacterium]
MGQIVQQAKSVDALKLLNNAIVTSRLYPPESPQVANAVERGYKGLKLFLREQGPLLFSNRDDSPWLCGQPLEQEILNSFPNLVVFRQLRLLGLSQLLIGADMDRYAFGQILYVFNTPLEKAKKAGGGMAYITSLGLASYFPEKAEGSPVKVDVSQPAETKSRKLVKIQPELLACLCGMDKSPKIQDELIKRLQSTESIVDLLAAGVGHILQGILKKGEIVSSPLFPLMLQGAERLIGENDLRPVTLDLARILVQNLREPALCVLLSQEYPEGFGKRFFDGLIGFLTTDNLGTLFILFREQIAKSRLADGDKSPRMKLLGDAILRLMNTGKGKHFLGAEKARALIHEGEAVRKKSRLEAGIHGLLRGNLNPLKSDELLEYLPEALAQKFATKAEHDAETLIKRIGECLRKEGGAVNGTVLSSTVTIGEKLVADGRLALIDIFLEPLMIVFRQEALDETLLEKIVNFLHLVMQASWNLGDYGRGDGILNLFHMIRSGQLGRSTSLKRIIGKIQDQGIQRAMLPTLLAECLASPMDEALAHRLVFQGPVAVRFLVESLVNTEDMDDRIKIIDLLTTNSCFLTPIIHEYLPAHMPWYGKRNLLKLLGETGEEEDAQSVLPFFKHEDFRVQKEAFLCLYKIGGKNRKTLFLEALAVSSELLKVQLIDALNSFCDDEVATQLVELLVANENFTEKNRTDILLQVLETLGRCASPAAIKGIESFLQTRKQRSAKKIPDHIWGAAEKALKYLENDLKENRKKYLQAGQLRKNALKQSAQISKSTKDQKILTGLPQEQTVRAFLAQGDKSGAKELLVQMIEQSARAHNFIQADNLRQWLIEVDPAAFSYIIKAAELIDREKVAAIDKGHLEIWSKLYECLSSEEFAAVYHAQKHTRYLGGEVIVKQGAVKTSLFFINSGKVKLYFEDQKKEVLVKTMGAGEIFGSGAFFDASVWTISVASVSPSEISSLKLDKLREWSDEYPGLESKLKDFCSKFERIDDFIKKSSKDRRLQERHEISGRVSTALVDNRGQAIGVSAMAELSDISEGGVSYQVRISKKDNARLLLGRKVQVRVPVGEEPGEFTLLYGDILAVRSTYMVESDYSVHVTFDALLEKGTLQEIIKAARREAPVK